MGRMSTIMIWTMIRKKYLKAYKGTAYKGPHRVPGTLEAEDFDEGAQNVAYYESDSKLADVGYRGSHAVDVRAESKASGGYYIGDVQPVNGCVIRLR